MAPATPDAATHEPSRVVFFDSRAFDRDLSQAMRSESPEIVVEVPVGFSLNKIPERIDRWLYTVKEAGGPVVAEPEHKQRGVMTALVDVVVSMFVKLDEIVTLAPSERYGATLLYRPDGTVNKIVFKHRSAPSRSFALITSDEYNRERERPATVFRSLGPPRDSQSPDIILVRPTSLSAISSPTDIELRFLPKDQARIEMRSLRVLYGTFGINVADRLIKHATVTDTGVVAREARLPAGSHWITVEIADSRNRVSRESFRFIVKEAKE